MDNSKNTSPTKEKLKLVLFFLIFVAFLVLIYLPKDFFDRGESICLSVQLFDRECYGCGMTRAIQHLIHLDFSGAYSYNKLSVVVLPLLIYLILFEIYKTALYFRNKTNTQ